jgi:hypothetical protein
MKTKPTEKVPTNSEIVVRLAASNVLKCDVDAEIFDDPYLEAVTRAMETGKAKQYGAFRPIVLCWESKRPARRRMYNVYWALINAGCYHMAEMLREKFKMQTDRDLAKEPVYATCKS